MIVVLSDAGSVYFSGEIKFQYDVALNLNLYHSDIAVAKK